jgi:hypothetical protein
MTDNSPSHRPLADAERVISLLMQTQSVTLTARMLGVAAPTLSVWLHRPARVEWWKATKAKWAAALARERYRRYKTRKAAREGRTIGPRKPRKEKPKPVRCVLCGHVSVPKPHRGQARA